MNMGWADEPDCRADRTGGAYWHEEQPVPRIAGRLLAVCTATGRIARWSSSATRRAGHRVLAVVLRRSPGRCPGPVGPCPFDVPGNLVVHAPLVSRPHQRRRCTPADRRSRNRCREWTVTGCGPAPRRTGTTSG